MGHIFTALKYIYILLHLCVYTYPLRFDLSIFQVALLFVEM